MNSSKQYDCFEFNRGDSFMKVKFDDLSGDALDFAVAILRNVPIDENFKPIWYADWLSIGEDVRVDYSPSTDRNISGDIWEAAGISLQYDFGTWIASASAVDQARGNTATVAALRCWVLINAGEYVEIPDEVMALA
jgi:hypothetical protein